MLADYLERRINTSLENKYLLNMFALEKSLVFILNSITSNGALLERMKTPPEKLGFNSDQAGILEDLIIENQQCYRRAEIHTQVLANLMGTRTSIFGHNLNYLIKKFTIWTVAIMLTSLVVGLFGMNVTLPLPMEEALAVLDYHRFHGDCRLPCYSLGFDSQASCADDIHCIRHASFLG